MIKIVKRFVMLSIALILCTSCIYGADKKNENKAEESLEKFKNASEIKVDKALVSLNPHYTVYVDNEKIGEVTGKYVNITGDTFTFKNTNGEILSKEKQVKRWGTKLSRSAEVYNKEGNIVGYIGEEKFNDLLKWGYRFHFYDKDKNEVAYTKDIMFSLKSKYEVYNLSDKLICTIEGQFSINNSYKISIKDENNVPQDQLVYFTCIVDAIKTSDDAKVREEAKEKEKEELKKRNKNR